jgi:hypothetical protein
MSEITSVVGCSFDADQTYFLELRMRSAITASITTRNAGTCYLQRVATTLTAAAATTAAAAAVAAAPTTEVEAVCHRDQHNTHSHLWGQLHGAPFAPSPTDTAAFLPGCAIVTSAAAIAAIAAAKQASLM